MVSDTTPVQFNTIVQWTEKSRRVGIVIVVGERRIAQHRRFRLGGTDGKQHGALAGALQGNCRRQRLPDWDCEANRQPLTPQARYSWCNPYYFATERTERAYAHPFVGDVGHNLPQEAPRAFADAVIDVERW
jgi:hypothetical protein